MSVDLRALVAHENWEWQHGMKRTRGATFLNGRFVWAPHSGKCEPSFEDPRADDLPDLEDPGTLGAIEHGLLAEVWPGTHLVPYENDRGWWIAIMPGGPWPTPAPTKAEALVNALLVAP